MTLILSEVSRLSRTFAVREHGLLAVLVVNAVLLGLWSAGAAPENTMAAFEAAGADLLSFEVVQHVTK